ncbi:SCN2A [Symbiodinium microadriaticum]|nr:SCN2A [Symbiodinium microadriaticum]
MSLTTWCPGFTVSSGSHEEDESSTDLLQQCRAMHQDLIKLAMDEQALLFKLSTEVQRAKEQPEAIRIDIENGSDSVHDYRMSVEESHVLSDSAAEIPVVAVIHETGERRLLRFGSRQSRSSDAISDPFDAKRSVTSASLSSDKVSTKKSRAGLAGIAGLELPSQQQKGVHKVPSDNSRPCYSINGIRDRENPYLQTSVLNILRTNFSSSADEYRCWCSGQLARTVLWLTSFLENCCSLEEPERRGRLARFVNSTVFSISAASVILLNAAFILYTTDLEMRNIDQPLNTDSNIYLIELVLASFYVVELLLKLMVHKIYFFWNAEMAWNWFDFFLVVFSIIENLLVYDLLPVAAAAASNDGAEAADGSSSSVNLGFLRLIRLCKIVKILRVFRTLKFFSELRLMLDCVLGSLINAMWCVIMLVFVMYVFGLLLQQGIVQYLMEQRTTMSPEAEEYVFTYFRSVFRTVVTLFQSSTSGVDWNEPYKALEFTGDVMPAAFLVYIAFVFISVWNIVTSTFVEKALKLAQPDVDMLILEQQLQDFEDCKMLARLFKSMRPTDDDERIGMEEFRQLVETFEFRSYLQTRGIDIKNAETFFKMLVELQGEPMIDATTFANACVRMKGAATSIDLQTVMFTTHLMNQEQRRFFQSMYNRLMTIETILHDEHPGSQHGEDSIPGPFLTQSLDERTDPWPVKLAGAEICLDARCKGQQSTATVNMLQEVTFLSSESDGQEEHYVGEFLSSQLHGYGVITSVSGCRVSGRFEYGFCVDGQKNQSQGHVYVGEMQRSLEHGPGIQYGDQRQAGFWLESKLATALKYSGLGKAGVLLGESFEDHATRSDPPPAGIALHTLPSGDWYVSALLCQSLRRFDGAFVA